MKRICAVTMVRNDEFFIRKWVSYYGAQLGEDNLYIFFDGEDQVVPECCRNVHATVCKRVEGLVAKADKGRIGFLSERAEELFAEYDMVIGTDVDEFLVVDPAVHMSLPEYLSSKRIDGTLSGLGVDVGQNLDKEAGIDASMPFLSQRRYAYLSPRYTKASVISRPLRWGSGFHRVKGHNFHIDENLFLFHFGCVDLERLKSKMHNADLLSNGWSRHLKKRARTMLIVTHGKARAWESLVPVVRRLQTLFRPVYAWNKPTVFGLKFVVKIPDRFSEIV